MAAARLKISRSNSKGFTIIEVLMAVLVMTVGLLGLLQSVNVAYEHNLRNNLREEAVAVALEQMNAIRRMKLPKNTPYQGFSTAVRGMGGIYKKFAVTSRAQPIGGDSNRLEVAVRWHFKNMTTTYRIYSIRKM